MCDRIPPLPHTSSWCASGYRCLSLYILNYLLFPWSRVILENLTGSQLVKKFPVFYGTRRFITAFTRARHLSLSRPLTLYILYLYNICLQSCVKQRSCGKNSRQGNGAHLVRYLREELECVWYSNAGGRTLASLNSVTGLVQCAVYGRWNFQSVG